MEEELKQIESERDKQLNDVNSYYDNVLKDNEDLYNKQNEYTNNWETTQNELLDKQLKYNTDLINQQKEKAQKQTKTETNKALNDYAAYVNPYGYQAERIADNGLSNAGVSETSKLGAYTTYQNRVSQANAALQEAITSYDNDINQARLENDTQKAQNALEKLQMQLSYLSEYNSNKMTVGESRLDRQDNINNTYYTNKQNAISNNQWERNFAESQRQYNENLAYQKQQDAQDQANWEKEYALNKYSTYKSSSGGKDNDTETIDTLADAKTYGTFSNGYQPKGISGHGTLSKSKDKSGNYNTVSVTNKYGNTKDQALWEAEDGTLWYWDGQNGVYKKFQA